MAPDMEAEDMEAKDREAEALLEELRARAEQEQLTATYKGALCKGQSFGGTIFLGVPPRQTPDGRKISKKK